MGVDRFHEGQGAANPEQVVAEQTGGRERHTIEVSEYRVQRAAQVGLENGHGLAHRETGHVDLQLGELAAELEGKQIDPQREELSELDPQPAEALEQLAKAPAVFGGAIPPRQTQRQHGGAPPEEPRRDDQDREVLRWSRRDDRDGIACCDERRRDEIGFQHRARDCSRRPPGTLKGQRVYCKRLAILAAVRGRISARRFRLY